MPAGDHHGHVAWETLRRAGGVLIRAMFGMHRIGRAVRPFGFPLTIPLLILYELVSVEEDQEASGRDAREP